MKLKRKRSVKTGPLKKFSKHLIWGIIASSLTLIIFGWLSQEVFENELVSFDSRIIGFFKHYESPLLTLVMRLITNFGSPTVLIIIALFSFYLLYRKYRHYWDSMMIIVSLAGGFALNELLKIVFHRPRPNAVWLTSAGGYSFPSGHTMVSATFYGFLAYILWLNLQDQRLRYLSGFGLVLLVVLIGISRIYLLVHYPSDVIAGFVAGGFWLIGCILGLQTIRYYKSDSTKKDS